MLAALAVVLLAGLIIAGTFFWLGRREPAVDGPPELIKAPAEPYKVKPPNPGGLDIKGESETAFETSAGEDRDSQLDLDKLPETPVAKPPKELPSQPGAQAASFSWGPSPIRRRQSGRGLRSRRASPQLRP
jgi:hypothetical protein